MTGTGTETENLSETLKLLADPNRLNLIEQLREPKIVDEIELTPSRVSQGSNPDRQLTRQAIRHHLRQLRDEGLIETSARRRSDGRTVSEFRVNHTAFYQLVEELRQLNQRISRVREHRSKLEQKAEEAEEGWPTGPKLVLVKGLRNGEVFPLNRSTANPPRGWVIGSSEDCSICLSYDPDVAYENTEILERDDDLVLLDLRSSSKGTIVNGTKLPFGGQTNLEHGDIFEVGSSAFVFREH